MRSILAVIALTATTVVAFGEEAYTITGKAYGACIGTQMRLKYNPPERIADVIELKCGKLEKLEEEQFHAFITHHIGETLTAELAATIVLHDVISLRKIREGAVEAYLKAIKQAAKPDPLELR